MQAFSKLAKNGIIVQVQRLRRVAASEQTWMMIPLSQKKPNSAYCFTPYAFLSFYVSQKIKLFL